MQSSGLPIARLRSEVKGQVIAPEDAGYDEASTLFYGGFEHLRPGVIVKAAGAADVSRVVTIARESGTELAVRGGGHSNAGHSTTDGGIVLELGAMRALDIDVEGRTAWAEAGLTAGEYTTAAGEHGLATPFGDTGSVGLGGIALSGGAGFLVRKHGLTIDSLLAAELVTADGELRQVDAQTDPDLFWAIRGGGGNFGVVTRLKFRLHEVGPVVGGMLILPATADVIAGFMEAADEAPEELSAIANVMPAPPMPFLPAELHGRLILLALMVYAGGEDEGAKALAPFRALATPLADMLAPMRYPDMFQGEEEGYHPTAVASTMFLDKVDRDVAATILEFLESSDAAMRVAQLRVFGGALGRVPADATAYAHRQSRIMANVASFYTGPDDRPVREAWLKEFAAALRQDDQGAYVGFLNDEGPERVRAAYPGATWDRLAEIKKRYDPANLFRRNQNIPPAP